MLNRWKRRRNDEGQALVIVIALVAISAILILALEVSVIGDSHLSATTTSQEQALQAAEAGLADYQTWVNGTTPLWSYASDFCSSGAFTTGICAGVHPDPQNPAFMGISDPNSCTSSSATDGSGTPGQPHYYGWVTYRGNTSGFAQQFQYVVDSSLATPSAGYVHIFVTGRAGHSGHFTCTTVKALYNGPQYNNSADTTFLTPVACNGQPLSQAVTAPGDPTDPAAYVTITATGGTGETGGTGSSSGGGVGIQGVLSTGGGAGGVGETVTATYAVSANTSLAVDVGCQAGTPTNVAIGGSGFSSGGTSPGNAGGGGGSTAVCQVTATFPLSDCTAANVTTTAGLASHVFMVAAGGGGGGEGRALASGAGATGGTGQTTSFAGLGVVENGGNGLESAYVNGTHPSRAGAGGAGGTSSTFSPTGGAGNVSTSNSDGGSDGGSGGGGFDGGAGGSPGWGGGGGGAGSSFFNTTGASGLNYYSGGSIASSGSFVGTNRQATSPNAGQVTITWLDSTGAPISTVNPTACGMAGADTSSIPGFAGVKLELIGGTGGQGTVLGRDPHGNTSNGGAGAAVVGTFFNKLASTVYITTVQGCNGAIGVENGPTAGGLGLGNGGANCLSTTCAPGGTCPVGGCTQSQGNAGSGGGASTICVGTTAPSQSAQYVNMCCPTDTTSASTCTVDPSTVLMTTGAGGGGGGAASEHNAHTPGGNGGGAGLGTNLVLATATDTQTGVVPGNPGTGGAPGTAGSTAFSPDGQAGTPGNACTLGYGGDGGGGGGGYGGGGGGGPGTTSGGSDGCQNQANQTGGGGGGSSYLYACTEVDQNCSLPLQLEVCSPGGFCLYSPCVANSNSPFGPQSTLNSSTQPLTEAEWCPAPSNPAGGASGTLVSVQSSPPSVLSQSPAPLGSTAW